MRHLNKRLHRLRKWWTRSSRKSYTRLKKGTNLKLISFKSKTNLTRLFSANREMLLIKDWISLKHMLKDWNNKTSQSSKRSKKVLKNARSHSVKSRKMWQLRWPKLCRLSHPAWHMTTGSSKLSCNQLITLSASKWNLHLSICSS